MLRNLCYNRDNGDRKEVLPDYLGEIGNQKYFKEVFEMFFKFESIGLRL